MRANLDRNRWGPAAVATAVLSILGLAACGVGAARGQSPTVATSSPAANGSSDGNDHVVSERELATIRAGLRDAAVSHGFLQLDQTQLETFGADLCERIDLAGEPGSTKESLLNSIRDGRFFPEYEGGFPEAIVQEIGVAAELAAATMCRDMLASSP